MERCKANAQISGGLRAPTLRIGNLKVCNEGSRSVSWLRKRQNHMNIPEQFSLMGRTFTVRIVQDLHSKHGLNGRVDHSNGEILIQPPCDGYDGDWTGTEITFCHELVHAILVAMAAPEELTTDERFVELFARLLHNFQATQSGDLRAGVDGSPATA